jgi:hypothetical protein
MSRLRLLGVAGVHSRRRGRQSSRHRGQHALRLFLQSPVAVLPRSSARPGPREARSFPFISFSESSLFNELPSRSVSAPRSPSRCLEVKGIRPVSQRPFRAPLRLGRGLAKFEKERGSAARPSAWSSWLRAADQHEPFRHGARALRAGGLDVVEELAGALFPGEAHRVFARRLARSPSCWREFDLRFKRAPTRPAELPPPSRTPDSGLQWRRV